MTKEEAIKLYDSAFWEHLTYRQRAAFQFKEELLCMPFGVFHEAVEKSLGRPVWSHEFASERLKKEFYGETTPPTFQEIMDLIPAEKRIVVVVK